MEPRVGVVTLQTLLDLEPLKRILLYFDEVNIAGGIESFERLDRQVDPVVYWESTKKAGRASQWDVHSAQDARALYEYLIEHDWCSYTAFDRDEGEEIGREIRLAFCRQYDLLLEDFDRIYSLGWITIQQHCEVRDAIYERHAAGRLTQRGKLAVPTFPTPDPLAMWEWGWGDDEEDCHSIVFKQFPVPSEMVPIEDILAFKADNEAVRKRNALIAWQNKLARENYTPREIHEELEYLLGEYTSYMQLLDRRFTLGVVETVVKLPLAIVENLAQLRLSQVLDPIFDLIRLKLELDDAERKAPGIEVAYVADAQKRFAR